ncbi:TlpA disulfide reductase family protein [Tenacibaculum sp. 1_MG-2023]|uniref:TlpA family protein disulfide reductase n=1 Tax=Tenacibaculum sp. 1_MG-2023 TaxID=3062653 RepID=UPI0026E2BBCF|nr:TlpA disulfide reductase family protein [Tenacibaculum sp. 1_MG-2023]MDO6676289.1 TlpA disulfide reductase family protein [Tenacibaculum sp. 1_MG-2023]
MRNIVLALLSIGVGFAISFFGLDIYSNSISNEDKTIAQSNKVITPKKEGEPPINEDNTSEETLTVKGSSTGSFSVDTEDIQKNFDNWEAYTKENIDLMSTFIPMDDKGAIMEKGIFLTLLRTGAYIPIKSKKDGKVQYQLTGIDDSSNEKIKKSIVSKASIAHQYFKMEGKKLPNYNFIDLNGNAHNKADTKGKLLVLKCWFITCKVCVEEFPELNELVDKYKDEKIEFVSLAFDKKDELVKFLETKEFKYPTIPEQKDYMTKKLKVKQYPTHLIIDSNGIIIKMVNNVKTLTSELERIMGK